MKKMIVVGLGCSLFVTASFAKNIVIGTTTQRAAGFFCELQKVVIDLIHCDKYDIYDVVPNWRDPFYPFKDDPSENGWDLFFQSIPQKVPAEQEKIVVPWIDRHEIHGRHCTAQWVLYDRYLPYREYVHGIMNKYFKVKDHIIEQLNEFYSKNMEGYYCIGVHIRFSAAHAREVPGGKNPLLSEYYAEINQIIREKQGIPIKIFLATDSNLVVRHCRAHYKDLLYYPQAPRSIGEEDPMFILPFKDLDQFNQRRPGYKAGLYVLLDCLTLSKCDVMIHTTSNFTSFVSFFNPSIKSVYLPKGLEPVCTVKGNEKQNEVNNPFLNIDW
jgi:hypothetical protein